MQWFHTRSLTGKRSLRRILWIIVVASVLVRVGSALYQGSEIKALPGVADQISYYELALRVIDGHGFSFGEGWWPATAANEPTAHWSFLYVLFLASVFGLSGADPLAARLIQAVLCGVLQPLLTWRIGRRLFGERVGLVSAALAAFYSYFAFYGGALVTEALYIVALLWVLDLATRLGARSCCGAAPSGYWLWVQLGLSLSVAALLRQVALLFLPVILLWIVWPTIQRSSSFWDALRSCRPMMTRVAVCVAIPIVAIIPWTLRNYAVFDRVVLLNTNAGFVFFWANHPVHGNTFIPILPGDGSEYGNLIPEELRALNEAELDKALLERGLVFVVQDPFRYIRLSISRVKEYFKFWPSRASSALSNCARVISFGLCLPFFVSGLLIAARRSASLSGAAVLEDAHLRGISLIMILAGLYSLVHVLTWTLVRYRLPVDAMLMPFAALSMVHLFDRINPAASDSWTVERL